MYILFDRRLLKDKKNNCLLTVDGTDYDIAELVRTFYSHKIQYSALRYEVALSILTGDICWISGPYEAGSWPDIKVFRDSLMSHLEKGERAEADDDYIGEHPQWVKCPKGFANLEETEYIQQRCRNCQETVNKRLKQFGVLKQKYRYDLRLYGDVVRACAVLTQFAIDDGDKLFACGYNDHYNHSRGEKRRCPFSDEDSVGKNDDGTSM